MKKKLNTTLIYVLSVVSLLCCCIAGLSVFLALPAFLVANNKMKAANLNPEEYEESDIKAMNTAKVVALVALIITGLYFLYNIYYFSTTDWDLVMEEYRKAMEQYQ